MREISDTRHVTLALYILLHVRAGNVLGQRRRGTVAIRLEINEEKVRQKGQLAAVLG